MIQSGKFSMTTSAENSGDLSGISEIWVDTGVDGTRVELTEEGFKIITDRDIDLEISASHLLSNADEEASELNDGDVIFVADAANPSAPFSAGSVEFESADAAIRFYNANY